MDIVDVAEIARRAGTTPGTVHSWRNRHADFPAPAKTLAIGPVWDWAPVDRWIFKRRRKARTIVALRAEARAPVDDGPGPGPEVWEGQPKTRWS